MQHKINLLSSFYVLSIWIILFDIVMDVNCVPWWLRDNSNSTNTTTTITNTSINSSTVVNSTVNNTQMLLVPVVVTNPTVYKLPPCAQIYGQFCTDCDENQCLKCQSTNLTLRYRDPNSTATFFQACICQYPYVYNLTVSVATDYQSQQTLYSGSNPCIICTDKFTLQQCSPALFRYNISQTNNSTTTVMLAFNRDDQITRQLGNISTVARYWLTAKLMIGGTLIAVDRTSDSTCSISTQKSSTSYYCLNMTYIGLAEQAYQLYINNNYTLTPTFKIGIFKRYDLYVNASGSPLPQSYRSPIMFKSLLGFEPDDQYYTRDYSNMESIIYELPMYKPVINNTVTNTITNSSNSTSNSTNTTSSNTSAQSNTSVSPSNQQSSSSSNSSGTPIQVSSNNYGIVHEFTPIQQTIKTGIQIALVSLSSLGLAGVGASSWLTTVLSLTHLFGNMGLYSAQLDNQTQAMSTVSYSRLLLFESLPNITVQFSDVSTLHSLAKVANFTLTLNPLILPTPVNETVVLNAQLPTFSMSLFSTVLISITFMPILTVLLCYLRCYTRNKRQYQFSHIFTVLSDSNLIKRVLYMSMRGLYPIMLYAFIVFMQALFQVGTDGFKLVVWDIWNIMYATLMAIIALIVIILPIIALCCFSPTDKNNVHIYWRMYGKQMPESAQTEQKQSKQTQQSSSQHKIKDDSDQCNHDNKIDTIIGQDQHSQQQHKHKHKHKHNNDTQQQTPNLQQYLEPSSLKVFIPSLLPVFYFIIDYLYMVGFMCFSIFATGDIQKYSLLALSIVMAGFTLYCYITVGVSKAYAVVRIVQMLLQISLMVCQLMWDQYITCSYLGLGILYAISVWAVAHLFFLLSTMLYWQVKGLGVHAYFLNKITPIHAQSQPKQTNTHEMIVLQQVQNSNIFNSTHAKPTEQAPVNMRHPSIKKIQPATENKTKTKKTVGYTN